MLKAIVVEDNDLNCKLFKDLLAIRNIEVIISKDGLGVVPIAILEKPDVILMDIQLRGTISGLVLIKELKRNEITRNIPIIAITAFAMKNDEIKIMSSGCDFYLSKPLSIDKFFDTLDRVLFNDVNM